jgi:hypothetical protein
MGPDIFVTLTAGRAVGGYALTAVCHLIDDKQCNQSGYIVSEGEIPRREPYLTIVPGYLSKD